MVVGCRNGAIVSARQDTSEVQEQKRIQFAGRDTSPLVLYTALLTVQLLLLLLSLYLPLYFFDILSHLSIMSNYNVRADGEAARTTYVRKS